MKTVLDIIEALLLNYFDQYYGREDLLRNPNLAITYEKFTQTLCNPVAPMYSSRRSVREKWKLLHELGYLKQLNQRASKFNIDRIVEDFYPEE